jgi:hypothetical protein
VILAAGLLVLLGLGLFVAGILTGTTALYWACVAACVVAAVLLIAVRRQVAAKQAVAPEPEPAAADSTPASSTRAQADGDAGQGAPVAATARREKTDAASATDAPGAGTPDSAPDAAPADDLPDPEVEEVEVTDLLLVVDLKDQVLVVDEHPRYHLAGCTWLAGRDTLPLPLDEARTDGFTPCAVCSPDRTLAERARAARHSGT